MKGCGFKLPLRAEFVHQIGKEFEAFTRNEEDAKGSLLMWEMFDPEQVLQKQDVGSYANRGWHYNGKDGKLPVQPLIEY